LLDSLLQEKVMGVKRRASRLQDGDKKARFEVGLGKTGDQETEQMMLEQVLKEVRAPSTVQTQLDTWTQQISSILSDCRLQQKSSVKKIKNFPLSDVEDMEFPGGQVTSCGAVGALNTKSLVFPAALARLEVKVKLNRLGASQETCRTLTGAVLAKFYSCLESSPLVSSLQHCTNIYPASDLTILVTPSAKWGKHLRLEVGVSLSSPASPSLQSQLDSLTSSQPYQAVCSALEIWRRQCSLVLPANLLPSLLLHCQQTNIISDTSKSWQVLRKVWTVLAGLELTDRQLILGLSEPVPASSACSPPLLDREGQTPLFPGLARPQWSALVQFAGQAVGQTVETSLLRSVSPSVIYDRVYHLSGQVDVFSLMNNLARGLEDRVTLLAIVEVDTASQTLHLGLRFQPELHWKPSSLGPLATSPEAASWRQFWGERSELRRFQDGEVREVVTWPGDRDRVVTELVIAVVARHHKHCSLERETGGWAGEILQGDGGAGTRSLVDRITPLLYSLDLPLGVAGVTALGPAGRATKVGADLVQEPGGKTVREEGGVAKICAKTGMAPRYLQPLQLLLAPEQSGKWPRDPEALRRVRLAWLLEVGEKLEEAVPGLVSRVREETVLLMLDSRVLALKVADRPEECEISSWLAGLHQSQPAWSGAARLAKRWAASQLMSSVPELALEVSLAVVLTSSPLPPASPAPAFFSWLETLARHDWNTSPLCDPACTTNVPARSSLPPMAVLCPHSPSPSYWTRGVTWPQLQRLVSLAALSLNTLNTNKFTVKDLFSPSLSSYEALIHLRPLQVPTRHLSVEAVLSQPPLRTEEDIKTIPILDHDPVRILVETLTSCYGHLAKFYYDRYGGTVIAVKILETSDPGEESRVKLADVGGRMLVEASHRPTTNWGAVVEDWAVLGKGIVKNVEILNTDSLCL